MKTIFLSVILLLSACASDSGAGVNGEGGSHGAVFGVGGTISL